MKEYNCFKCKNIIKKDIMISDGKFESVKNKYYCELCYFTKSRIKDLKKDSISINLTNKKGK
tara:strand:- start:57 stop:242 length:186 start_codon:yes stop_codon:yes gene_type:complete